MRNYYIKVLLALGFLPLLLLCSISGIAMHPNEQKGFLQTNEHSIRMDTIGFNDSLGIVNYEYWLAKGDTTKLILANELFSQFFICLPKEGQFDYSISLARKFSGNKEEASLVKEWYLRAIDSFDAQSADTYSDISKYQRIELKYKILLEFTKLYSGYYGKCEDAVEVLRNYKMQYNFKYVKYNRGLDQTDKIWLRLVKEDQRLSWDCEEK